MQQLLMQISTCTLCTKELPFGPRPVVRASETSRVLIIGQAPGSRVHNSGVPWDDASGQQLRQWLSVSDKQFYNPELFAIVPMGFCYPGKGKSGDLPPRPECAPAWHKLLLDAMPTVRLTLLIGQYAQAHYLGANRKRNLTETVRNYQAYLPAYFPLPHPSPRNRFWQAKNPWFTAEVLPQLRNLTKKALA